jgi:AcrR family transcriptional regulator
MTGAASRSPRRGAGTHASLVAAGQRLLSDRSADAVSIDEIVQVAKVSKGSFYTHFADKQALVSEVTRTIRLSVEGAVTRVNADVDDSARRVARAVCVYLRHAIEDPERAGVLLTPQLAQASLLAALNKGVVEDLSAGMAAGRFRTQSLEAGVLLVLGVAQLGLARVAQDPRPDLAATLAQQIGAMLLCGLGIENAEAQRLAAQAADAIVRSETHDLHPLFSDTPQNGPST